MKKFLLLCMALLSGSLLFGQETLYPYLVGGKYGLADKNGQLKIEPQFEEINFEGNYGLLAAKKDGLWGIYQMDGTQIVDHTMQQYRVSSAYVIQTDILGQPIPVPGLLLIQDTYAQVWYYLHPDHPRKSLTPFIEHRQVTRGRKHAKTEISSAKFGILKVATRDKKINFIDTTGTTILSEGVYDGTVINENFFAVCQEDGYCAVFSRSGKQLTDYLYEPNDMRPAPKAEFLILEYEYVDGNSRKQRHYTLLNKQGKKVYPEKEKIRTMGEDHILIQHEGTGGLYRYDGKEVFSIPNTETHQLNYSNPDLVLLKTKDYRNGLVNVKGELLLDTVFTSIRQSQRGLIICYDQRAEKSTVLDPNFQELFSYDSLSIESDILQLPGYFKAYKNENYRPIYGLIDSTGKLVLPVQYERIKVVGKCTDLVTVQQDGKSSVVDFEGNTILPFTDGQLFIDCPNNSFGILKDSLISKYDRQGTLLTQIKTQNGRWSAGALNHNKPSKVVDRNGNELDKENYNFFSNVDHKAQRLIYFGRKRKKNSDRDYFNLIVNDKGLEITPEGYGLPENFTYNKTGENGGIRVVHIEDAIARKGSFRSGVIDFEGNWLVEPDYQRIRIVGNEFFVLVKEDGNTLLNRYGQQISDKSYDYFEQDLNEEIHRNRIVVGFLTNKKEVLKSLGNLDENDDYRTYLEKLKNATQPIFRLGYINKEGKEVIPTQYYDAAPFKHSYTTVAGINKKKPFADIIDLEGKVRLHTDYEMLEILYMDSTMLKANKAGRWGLIDNKGNILLEPAYEEIQEDNGFPILLDPEKTDVFCNGKILTVGPRGQRVDIEKLSEPYLVAKITGEREGNVMPVYVSVFDKEGNLYGDYSEYLTGSNPSVSTKGFGNNLPPGLMVITPGRNESPFLVDFVNNIIFKQ